MQERKRPMPVGIEDFGELIQRDYYFVDKTRFIRELLDSQEKIILVTRPRRFGKTLTLSMIQYFFALENAEENRKLFAGLDIGRAGEKYMREQGTRPVVFLTLKEVQRPTYASMLSMLSSVLQDTYACHRHLLASEAMDEEQKGYLTRVANFSPTGSMSPVTASFMSCWNMWTRTVRRNWRGS
ncbi:MAG: AAA family ATPase [Selenomonadaceae bacterium]|nr:AAA family ATPase [Selenomonadaceae bacterium]